MSDPYSVCVCVGGGGGGGYELTGQWEGLGGRDKFSSVSSKKKTRKEKDTWLTGQFASILVLLYFKLLTKKWWRGGKASLLPDFSPPLFLGKYLET